MSVRIGSNISSLGAQRRLGEASSRLSQTYERLSSGQRINRASDDAAGLSVAEKLNLNKRVYSQGLRNINDGVSALQIADSAVENLSLIVTRLRELAQQSANGSVSNKQREAIDEEAQALSQEYFRVARSTQFNRRKLFDGSLPEGLRLQAGFGVNGSIQSLLGGTMGDGTFANAMNLGMGNQTYDVALGDLNGDGVQDMVAVNSADNNISVRLGNGDGTFSAAVNSATGGGPRGLSLGDVDGDGILDVVTSNTGGDSISVLLGNGDGSFRAPVSYAVGDSPEQVVLGDFDGDGSLDAVAANYRSNSVSVLMGNGDGTMAAAVSFAVGDGPKSVSIGDLDGDGLLDLVAANVNGDSVSVLLGNGNGTFSAALEIGVGSDPVSIALGDLDGDGALDIVTANMNGHDIGILLGNGDGTFSAADLIEIGGAILTGVALGDLNGDSILDIVVSGDNSFLLGNGNGEFGAVQSFSAGSGVESVTLGDLNGDGVSDIVTANMSSDNVSVLLGDTRDGIGPLLPFSLRTQADALQSLAPLDRKLAQLSSQRGVIGAFQSRLNSALNTLSSTSEAYAAAESRIRDVDIAAETANLVRLQITQQAASAILAQANQQPALTLKLLI